MLTDNKMSIEPKRLMVFFSKLRKLESGYIRNLSLSILRDLIFIRLKPVYNGKELTIRITIDLVAANIGLLFGYFLRSSYYFLLTDIFSMHLLRYWYNAIPTFTFVCFVSFLGTGLYSHHGGFSIIHRLIVVFRAVALAFLLYVFLAFLLQQLGTPGFFLLPRSSILTGWLSVLLFMSILRGGRIILYRKFVILPRDGVKKQLSDAPARDLVADEFGWVSTERTEISSRKPRSISAYFALWPYFGEEVVKTVTAILRSGKTNRWTGQQNTLFEQNFAKFCQCKYAIAVSNGTTALELALHAIGIGPGDEVIVPCRTFVASASCVVMRGAKPVIVDVDRENQNLTSLTVRDALSHRTKAIIAVHLAGWPCEMDSLMAIAQEKGLWVIEDCAQAHGAEYKGRPVGSLGDIAAFSFCQDKIISTGGEGGMVTTNSEELWQRAWSFKDHGKNYDTVYKQQHPPGFRWLHDDFGTNQRLTEIQAAIGNIQLRKLRAWNAIRRKNAGQLAEAFANIPGLRVTPPPGYIKHAYYKYYVFIRPDHMRDGWDRDRVMNAINDSGIPCFSGICGQIHAEKAFANYGLCPTCELPVSKELMDTSLMFLVHPTLKKQNIADTIAVVKRVMKDATLQIRIGEFAGTPKPEIRRECPSPQVNRRLPLSQPSQQKSL